MQPISFKGVYKINLPSYEAKTINDFVYDNTIKLSELREDVVKESMTNEEALINAPKQRRGQFNVPRVVE